MFDKIKKFFSKKEDKPTKPTKTKYYCVGTQFSRMPTTLDEGVSSAKIFREKVLFPLLNENDTVILDFDKVIGIASNYLEYVFWGHTPEDAAKIRIVSTEDPSLKILIEDYLNGKRSKLDKKRY